MAKAHRVVTELRTADLTTGAVGKVKFTSHGAFAVTRVAGRIVENKIGSGATNRLFTFNIAGLIEHIRQVTQTAAVGVRQLSSARAGG